VLVLLGDLTAKHIAAMFTFPDTLISVLTNGKHARMEDTLQDGDEHTVLPLKGGE